MVSVETEKRQGLYKEYEVEKTGQKVGQTGSRKAAELEGGREGGCHDATGPGRGDDADCAAQQRGPEAARGLGLCDVGVAQHGCWG